MNELDLSLVPPVFHEKVKSAFELGEAHGILWTFDNTQGLKFVFDNFAALKDRGIYEPMLVQAYQGTRTNWAHWRLRDLEFMFKSGDRRKIREAGDAMPDGEKFTLYRGVSGRQPFRKVSGMSWTGSLRRARWFAARHGSLGDPAVYKTVVSASDVYCFLKGRDEEEFVVRAKKTERINATIPERDNPE